ncbi:MAG: Uma2 family endonuclease [Planctomycetota bacterium]
MSAVAVPIHRDFRIQDVANRMPERVRWELVRGELRIMSPAGDWHGFVALNFAATIRQHVKTHDLGRVYAAETGFIIEKEPDTLRAPDVAFITKARLEPLQHGFLNGAPDLAVEVVSPSDTTAEVESKTQMWLDCGTHEVWVAYPKTKSVLIHGREPEPIILGPNDTLDGGPLLLGFTYRVGEFFE